MQQVRLEALRIAAGLSTDHQEVLEIAESLVVYITEGPAVVEWTKKLKAERGKTPRKKHKF